jgi:hypothetical protein
MLFCWGGVSVPRRPAFQDVGDEDLFTLEAHSGFNDFGQQLASRSYEGQPGLILLRTRSFANEDYLCSFGAYTGYRFVSGGP